MYNKDKKKMKRLSRKKLFPYWLLLPSIIILLALTVFPVIYSFVLSFQSFDTFGQLTGFAGLSNYKNVLIDSKFWNSVWVTFFLTVSVVIIEVIIGLLLAIIMRDDSKFMLYFRWIFIIPMIIAPLVVGIMFRLMFNRDMGVINYMLESVGLGSVNWLGDPSLAVISIMIVDVWQWTPMVFLILLAGLQSMPQDPIEAARLDGASKLQIFRDMTISHLKPILVVSIIMLKMDALRMFDTMYILTSGGPGRATEVISYLMYESALHFSKNGYANAGLIIVFMITMILSYYLIRLMRTNSQNER